MAGKINSKRKGKVGEQELVNLLKKFGFKARRTQQYAGNTGDAADVQCEELSGYHLEVKRTEQFNLYKAYDQVNRDIGEQYKTGIIFHRKNNKPWVAIMDAKQFLVLFKSALILAQEQDDELP